MVINNINAEKYKKTILSFAACSLLLLILMVYTRTLINSSQYLFHTDFFKFYQSARFYFAGQGIYDKIIYPLNANEALFWHQKSLLLNNDLNPPFLTLILLPSVWFSYSSALMIWFAFSMVTMIVAILLVLKSYPRLWSNHTYRLWALVALLLYFPNYLSLYIGQLSSILLLLTILSLQCCHHNKQRTAGILLGVLLSIKLFFGLFLILFAVRKQWRVLMYMLMTSLICFGSALWFFGFNAYRQYFHNLAHIYWYSANWNGSLLGFLTRLLGSYHEGNHAVFNLPQLTHPLYMIISGILLIIYITLIAPDKKANQTLNEFGINNKHVKCATNHSKYFTKEIVSGEHLNILPCADNLDWQFSLTIVLMLLISPLGWVYYFTLLIIPFITILRLSDNLAKFNHNFMLLSLTILLSSMPSHYQFPMQIAGPLQIFTCSSYYFYALILLFGLLLLLNKQITALRNVEFNKKLHQKFSSGMQLLIYLILAIPSLVSFIVAMIY